MSHVESDPKYNDNEEDVNYILQENGEKSVVQALIKLFELMVLHMILLYLQIFLSHVSCKIET